MQEYAKYSDTLMVTQYIKQWLVQLGLGISKRRCWELITHMQIEVKNDRDFLAVK